jgi:hypothetical protein
MFSNPSSYGSSISASTSLLFVSYQPTMCNTAGLVGFFVKHYMYYWALRRTKRYTEAQTALKRYKMQIDTVVGCLEPPRHIACHLGTEEVCTSPDQARTPASSLEQLQTSGLCRPQGCSIEIGVRCLASGEGRPKSISSILQITNEHKEDQQQDAGACTASAMPWPTPLNSQFSQLTTLVG